jgi:hypothetical protein
MRWSDKHAIQSRTIRVKKEHFASVVQISESFKGYVDNLYQNTEDRRARNRFDRLDSQRGMTSELVRDFLAKGLTSL